MNHFGSLRLKTKLMAIISIATLLILVASVIAFVQYDRKTFLENLVREQQIIGEIISQRSTAAISFNDFQRADENLSSLGANPLIMVGCIYTQTGLFASYKPVDQVLKCTADLPVINPNHDNETYLETLQDIRLDDRILGQLYLRSSLDQMHQRQFRLVSIVMIIAGISGIIGLYIASKLIGIVTHPLMLLERSAAKITASHDYQIRAEKTFDDDIGQLIDNINVMLDTIQEQDVALKEIAFHDALTGLPNRRMFKDRLDQEISRSRRDNRKLGLMFLDLDNFKGINDTMGHEAGDQLLVTIGQRLKESVRQEDMVCRLGGDEFTVLLIGIENAEAAKHVAEKIIANLRRSIQLGDHQTIATTSIGIAIFPDDSESSASLMTHADIAMYKAKEAGKNNYCVYERKDFNE
jgi:diguanylate cyclase (GGDEF)-like protein